MSKKIKSLLVDNELLNLEILETFISKIDYLELVGKAENAFEAIDFLQTHEVDLLFCDIQMPKVNGLELVKSLPNSPAFIFITAYDTYAINGFDVGAVDYLLKPISFDRFLRACNKAKEVIEQQRHKSVSLNTTKTLAHIFIKENDKLLKVPFSDILYVEAMGDYIKIITQTGRIITHSTLKAFEEKLERNKFVRTHKSFIIQIEAIKSILGNTIMLNNGDTIPLSKNFRDAFQQTVLGT